MKLLKALQDAFGKLPTEPDVIAFLRAQRDEMGGEDFSGLFFSMFCGRGYNQFVDYGAMALKLARLIHVDLWDHVQSANTPHAGERHCVGEMVCKLLFDDRHDCYQNVPYYIADFIKANPKLDVMAFWLSISDILIDSFNIHGTGDLVWRAKPEDQS